MSGVLNFPLTLRGAPRKPKKPASWEIYYKLCLEKLRASPRNRLLGKFTTSSAWRSSAQAKENSFLGKFISNSIGEASHLPWELFSREVSQKLKCGLRANSGASRTPLHTATGAAFPVPGRAPINRQSLRLAPFGGSDMKLCGDR